MKSDHHPVRAQARLESRVRELVPACACWLLSTGVLADHSGILIPESFTTRPQCATCDLMRSPNSALVPPAGSAPSLAKASRTLGRLSARPTVSFRRATMSVDVPLLTAKPT